MHDPLLEMFNIKKSFGSQVVLDQVNFHVRRGEVHILAGENGAGKSTLMRILSGVYADYSGEIYLEGKLVRFHSPLDAVRHGISIIHQELSLIPSMTIVDNIFLAREKIGIGRKIKFKEEYQECTSLLNRLGIEVDLNIPVAHYPIGVQQSIEIAKALAFSARILIMDEPTSALTDPEVQRLFQIIGNLKETGYGIIYITHKMEEIYRIADRITVLRDGKYIGTSEAAQLSREQLVRWMIGRSVNEQISRHPIEVGQSLLELKGFTVPRPNHGSRPAVNNTTFSLRAGEIVGLAGLQGSGTDILLKALYGAYGPVCKGEVLLGKNKYIPYSPRYALKQGIAFLSNDRKREGLVLSMSVMHNITLAALPKISPYGFLREKIERQLTERLRQEYDIRVADVAQCIGLLSGGNQQKVALAKCIACQPKVLLLNEPTRGVDIGAKHDIYALMNLWTQAGMGILLITSEMPELLALSDKIVVFYQGEITAIVDKQTLSAENVLEACMGKIMLTKELYK